MDGLGKVSERSFLMPGRPRLRYGNLFNNSSKRPRDVKTAEQFFTGYKTFQAKFEKCNFQDICNYTYIL